MGGVRSTEWQIHPVEPGYHPEHPTPFLCPARSESTDGEQRRYESGPPGKCCTHVLRYREAVPPRSTLHVWIRLGVRPEDRGVRPPLYPAEIEFGVVGRNGVIKIAGFLRLGRARALGATVACGV